MRQGHYPKNCQSETDFLLCEGRTSHFVSFSKLAADWHMLVSFYTMFIFSAFLILDLALGYESSHYFTIDSKQTSFRNGVEKFVMYSFPISL